MDIVSRMFLIGILILLAVILAVEVCRYRKKQSVAEYDSLTGLYSREGFFEKAKEKIRRNPNKKWYMVCTDIRNFKLANDLFGEEMGNKVLTDQAKRLIQGTCDEGICGRIAGDRFAMLIPKASFQMQQITEEMVGLQYFINDTSYKFHIFVGVYEITDPKESIQVMCDKANMAIDSFKGDYSKVIAYYDEKMLDRLIHEKNILSEFNDALVSGQFVMYLQPQISNAGILVGAEAIVRWHHPSKGILMPADFLGIIEKRGYIYRLDRWMWEQAVSKLADWKKRGQEDISISVNVSTKDFYYADLYKVFTSLVEAYEVEPNKLHIEITETVFMQDIGARLTVIEQLRDYGFHLEIDDFGSGYSSLSMLKDIEADTLKIDMTFLEETNNPIRARTILCSIITMAKELGMTVITEGVQNREHEEFLAQMGCDIFQGYYYAMPIPVEEFEQKYGL